MVPSCLRPNNDGFHDAPIGVTPAQLPNISIDDEMMDVDCGDYQQDTFRRAETEHLIAVRKEIEQRIAENEAHSVEPHRVKHHAMIVLRSGHAVPYMKDHDNRQVLDSVKDGRPDESVNQREDDKPNSIGHNYQQADQWHAAAIGQPHLAE